MVLLDNGGGGARGHVHLGLGPPDLLGLVEHVVVQFHPPGACDWRIVPDLSPHLIASVIDDPRGRRARAVVVGARSRSAVADVGGRVVTVGVRLRPGALRSLLSVPAAELTDRAIPLADAFGGRLLRDVEIGGDTPPSLLLNELLRVVRRAARRTAPDPVCRMLARASRVKGMADAFGLAERTLRDRVTREVGLSPKQAMSIARLYRALFAVQGGGRSWAQAAHVAGYADQSHLARECRALLGDSPSAWLARGSADSFKTGAARGR